MAQKISKKEILWGGIAQLSNFGASLILLPFVLTYLTTENIGLWYIFLTIGGLAQLAEFGFQPTIARHAAYIYAGANRIVSEGIIKESVGQINLNLLSNFIAASRYIYRIIAMIATAVLVIAGWIYINRFDNEVIDANTIYALGIYSLGVATNLYFGYFNGLLVGRGEQSNANKIIIASKLLSVICGIVFLYLGLGLLGLAISSLCAAIIARYLYHRVFYSNKNGYNTKFLTANRGDPSQLASLLWQSSKKLGAAQVGSFLILKGNFFIVGATLGLTTIASYGLTLQIFGLLSAVSATIFLLQTPQINKLQIQEDIEGIKHLYILSKALSLICFTIGSVFIIFWGNECLALLKSKTNLIDLWWLVILAIILTLELNHSLAATYLTTLNKTPFLIPSILSGISVLILSILSVIYSEPNLGILILIQGLVQLTYNNWKWPYEAARQLGITSKDYLNQTMKIVSYTSKKSHP